MSLGFRVDTILPHARQGERLKIGLCALNEQNWLQPNPDLGKRAHAFDARPSQVQSTPEAQEPGAELADLLGLDGGLEQAARAHWEDMCLLTRREGEDVYRLVGGAVAFPTDWRLEDKLGLSLSALHAPIHGYAEQLTSGVDRFMAKLKPGSIYGRGNWFVVDSPELCHLPNGREQFAGLKVDNAGTHLFARCERQTLRRLPRTEAILFTIGVYVEPLASLPQAAIDWLVDAARAIPSGELERRGIGAYLPALIGYAHARREELSH